MFGIFKKKKEIISPRVELNLADSISPEVVEVLEADKNDWFSKLKSGMTKTRTDLTKKLLGVFGGGKIDENLYEELESILLSADISYSATSYLLTEVPNKVSLKGLKDSSELKTSLKEAMLELLLPLEKPMLIDADGEPFVIMMVGINGAGKTTSIGKLTHYLHQNNLSVMLAAGDTFRAAAKEQLMEWGYRNNVTVISQSNGDSAAVCHDAIISANAKKVDVLLADTAGRLPTQLHLMEEIKKVKRVIAKVQNSAPHEIILVLDATIGQNAITQVKAFHEALGVTGLIITKLDGTAKGGALLSIAKEYQIPIRFIGVGESIRDFREFNATAFVDAIIE